MSMGRSKPIPLEIEDPELGEMLVEVVQHNATTPKKDHIIVSDQYVGTRTVTKTKTVGRNEPCPCGSGRKYKKCCV